MQVVDAKQLTRLLSGLAALRDAPRSTAVVRWAQAAGMEVNVIHFSKLINTLGRCDGFAAADAAFREMLAAGVQPDTVRSPFGRGIGHEGEGFPKQLHAEQRRAVHTGGISPQWDPS